MPTVRDLHIAFLTTGASDLIARGHRGGPSFPKRFIALVDEAAKELVAGRDVNEIGDELRRRFDAAKGDDERYVRFNILSVFDWAHDRAIAQADRLEKESA